MRIRTLATSISPHGVKWHPKSPLGKLVDPHWEPWTAPTISQLDSAWKTPSHTNIRPSAAGQLTASRLSQAESLQAPQVSEPQAVEPTFLITIVNCKLWTVSSSGSRQLTVDS
jgi:hypothetical protein